MGVICRQFDAQQKKFVNVENSDVKLGAGNFLIAIDGSSSRTGIAIINFDTCSLVGTLAVERDKKNNEDFVEYKIKLKTLFKKLMDDNLSSIKYMFYEEPFIGFSSATQVLMAIAPTIREIKIENAPKFDAIEFKEVNNQKWKKIFLAPDKVPNGSDNQKVAVQQRVFKMFGSMVTTEANGVSKLLFTEDECDAVGLGIACLKTLKTGYDADELLSKKKPKPFKYHIQYMTAVAEDEDEAEQIALETIMNCVSDWRIPQKVMDNGVAVETLNGRGAFDKHVYETMGNEDKLVLLIFHGGKYVDSIIKNGRNDLCRNYADNEYIMAVVWRNTRK